MRRLFVLRPQPGAAETVERAKAVGLDAVAMSLFATEPVDWTPPNAANFDGLLLTSANAVRKAGSALGDYRSLKVHAVGESTASAARDAGFTVADSGNGGVDQLVAMIPGDVRLLHLCGADRWAFEDKRITPVVVYRSRALPTAEGLALIEGQVAVVHSPRAAARLAKLVGDRSTIRIAAISEAAAQAAGNGWECVEAAGEPNDSQLLALAARLCQNPKPQ